MKKVPLTTIREIKQHPNSFKLALYRIYENWIIAGSGEFDLGDEIVFIPIGAILPNNIIQKIKKTGSIIPIHNNRVRKVNIRKVKSSGIIINLEDLVDEPDEITHELEEDLSEILNITFVNPIPYKMKKKVVKKSLWQKLITLLNF